MATYKKRGNKVKGENAERISKVEQESTTAEVFNTLDEKASKTEDWVIKNQQNIFIITCICMQDPREHGLLRVYGLPTIS